MSVSDLERLIAIERDIVKLTIGAASLYPGTAKARKDLERADKLALESAKIFERLSARLS
jgi:hypothetical protein